MKPNPTIQKFVHDEQGAVAVFTAFAIIAIMLASGIAVDFARLHVARAHLDASVRQAALGGAVNFHPGIDSTERVTAAANSVLTANAKSGLMTTNAATVSFRCSNELKTNGYKYVTIKNATTSCLNVNTANIVRVQQTARVTLAFGGFLGVNSLNISSTAEAAPMAGMATGTIPKPVNLAVVVDSTGSMNDTDNNCKDSKGNSVTRLNCVKMGLAYLFNGLAGADAKVQLLTFPPLRDTANSGNVACNPSGTPAITATYGDYNGTPYDSGSGGNEIYTVLPKVGDKAAPVAQSTTDSSFASKPGVLKSTSDFYRALGPYACGAGRSDCTNTCSVGLRATGGVGTYYGDSLAWARNNLSFNNDGTRQDVIIILSDGEANSSDINPTTVSAQDLTLKNLTLNFGIDNKSPLPLVFKTPATTGTKVTKSGSNKFVNQCKAAAEYANQLADFNPTVGGKSLGEPDIYSFYYGSGSNGCTTDSSPYTSCYTMKQIASEDKYFFSVATACPGNYGAVVDISAAFGQVLFNLMGASGKPRLVPSAMTQTNS